MDWDNDGKIDFQDASPFIPKFQVVEVHLVAVGRFALQVIIWMSRCKRL